MNDSMRADTLPVGTRVTHPLTGEPLMILAVEHDNGISAVAYDHGDCCTEARDRLGAAGRLHVHWMRGDTLVEVLEP